MLRNGLRDGLFKGGDLRCLSRSRYARQSSRCTAQGQRKQPRFEARQNGCFEITRHHQISSLLDIPGALFGAAYLKFW
ncbi:hypothetical protein ACUXV3_04650 [Roseobacteraceae bacterium NS-SX3]